MLTRPRPRSALGGRWPVVGGQWWAVVSGGRWSGSGSAVSVLLYSLAAGLVIVGGFAFGARTLSQTEGARAMARPALARFALAALCFMIAAAGVVVGSWFTLDK